MCHVKPRTPIKQSMFGSAEQVLKINRCTHQWEPIYGLLFGYMPVDEQCANCGTYRGPREENVK